MQGEIAAAAALGVDTVQIDDGWQQGVSANSSAATADRGVWEGFHAAEEGFWQVHAQRFPQGLGALQQQAQDAGMELGLWFAPDSSEEFARWQDDAAVILQLHRRLGVNAFKIDGVKARTRLGERRLQRFFQRVLRESHGRVVFDLDVTAEVRPGYWGMPEVGTIFVENRYTDFHRWWPHHSWRNAWQLARWVDPLRLRMEFLNPRRHQALYADDPLAPTAWPFASIVAMTLPFAPLAWCEVSHLDPDLLAEAAALLHTWRPLRQRWASCHHYALGATPSACGLSAMVGIDSQGLIIIAIRSLGDEDTLEIPWSSLASPPRQVESTQLLHGEGQLTAHPANQRGLSLRIPSNLRHVVMRVVAQGE
ncbi:MAG: hypothetical protein EA402_13460 [Planctomycetota bacterium]|nr:MAG: hypothetical protein EA402_13460 [Planctomycetota bacterium]